MGNPLIPALKRYCMGFEDDRNYVIVIRRNTDQCFGEPKLYSHILIERILQELGLIKLISQAKSCSKYNFELLNYVRTLIYGRVLNPASKIKTIRQNNDYYSPVITEFVDVKVYDTLDFIYKYQTQITNTINKGLIKSFGRTTNLIFYDVTNFYYHIDKPDEDIEGEDGKIIKGLRKIGVSKEHRISPIIQMGMFMDEQGIPISLEMFPRQHIRSLNVYWSSFEFCIKNELF